jgi:RNA polymerase sigma-B factor
MGERRRVEDGDEPHRGPAAGPGSSTPDESAAADGHSHDFRHLEPLLAEFADTPNDERRQSLRDRLVVGFLPLAQTVARRFSRRGVPVEDLVQVASIGLIKAIDRYDIAQSRVGFPGYAVPTMRGEIQRYFRDHTWAMRVPRRLKELSVSVHRATADLSVELGRAPRPSELAARIAVPVDDVLEALQASHEAYGNPSLDQQLSYGEPHSSSTLEVMGQVDLNLVNVEDRDTLAAMLADLPDRDRTVLVLRFFEDLTQTQIAQQVGLSQMHVSRVLTRTLDRLHARALEG